MLDSFITLQSLWVISITIFVGLVLSEYAGAGVRRLVQYKRGNALEKSDGLDYIVSSVFALLGLLVAFTFGLALDRYETRRDLVVKEANAIGTAHIRTAFAQEPEQTQLRGLLQDYAANRLVYGNSTFDKKREVAAKSSALRAEIAVAGVNAAGKVISPPLAPSLIASVNDVIDIGSEREASNLARVPPSVLAMLLGYALISAFMLGYAQKRAGTSQQVGSRVLFVLLTLALITILDLDRPASGAIKVSQQPMAELIAGFPK